MSYYQGRALRTDAPRRRTGRMRRVLILLGGFAAAAGLAHVPWGAVRVRFFDLRDVRVEGTRYLEAPDVERAAGLKLGSDLFALDLDRARQALLLQPRIAAATLHRRLPHGVTVRIEERLPVLLVEHGAPWEVDSAGVLLEPLAEGVVADVPMLEGPALAELRAGTHVGTVEVQRGLQWVRALGARDLQLGGSVSEIDVSDPRSTALTLMNGTRVLSPAWPPGTRALSALRVVLADLKQRGTVAQEVDLRFDNQVIVRPAAHSRSGDAARTS